MRMGGWWSPETVEDPLSSVSGTDSPPTTLLWIIVVDNCKLQRGGRETAK